jgi:hypothetical protein
MTPQESFPKSTWLLWLILPYHSSHFFTSFFFGFPSWDICFSVTRQVCEVRWSGPHQGLEAHVERYRNSPVMHKSVPDEPPVCACGLCDVHKRRSAASQTTVWLGKVYFGSCFC